MPWLVILSLFVARDAPAHALAVARQGAETALAAGLRPTREASWARGLEPIEVSNVTTKAAARIRLYDSGGEMDDESRIEFERIASRDPQPHPLARRLEQLVVKAAYHFNSRRVLVVSGWRERAGKHGTGEALDFKLQGVPAYEVAAYLRSLPRVGVGLYTHPGTQFVHVDVREPSYHWLDASPPGVHWRERQIGNPHGEARDAGYLPEMDLPI
jgi:uncharacterized protein YcbK (DUF882 family)